MKFKHYVVLCTVTSLFFEATAQTLTDSIQELSAFEKGKDPLNEAVYLKASSQALQLWNATTDEEKARFATKMFLVHYRRAKIMAASGNFEDSATELAKEAKMQKAFGGRLEFSTKSPDSFFIELVELQSQVTAAIGSNPLENQVGYYFEKDGDDFTASRMERGDDVGGFTIPKISKDEAIALVCHIKSNGSKFVVSETKWLVVPKGELPDVLQRASREIKFDSTGKMEVIALSTLAHVPSSQPDKGASEKPNIPSDFKPTAETLPSPKPPELVTPARDNNPPISMHWLVVCVTTAAIIGLLFLINWRK